MLNIIGITTDEALEEAITKAYNELVGYVQENYGIKLTATNLRVQVEDETMVTFYAGNFTELTDKELCVEIAFYLEDDEWFCEQIWAIAGDFIDYCKETGIIG